MELTSSRPSQAGSWREVAATLSGAGPAIAWRNLADRLTLCWAYVLASFLHLDEIAFERESEGGAVTVRVDVPPGTPLGELLAASDRLFAPRNSAGASDVPQCLVQLSDRDDQSGPAPSLSASASACGLVCSLIRADGTISVVVAYDPQRHQAIWVDQLIEHFCRLAVRITRSESVDPVEWLEGPRRERLLYEWNATTADYDVEQCLHWLVERQVARTPTADAAEFEGERLTYRELDRRANGLASLLGRRGVGRGARVPFCAERSFDLLIGVLGILKCGAAYVPIDPDFPADQKRQILADCEPPLVLVQRRFAERMAPFSTDLAVVDDADGEEGLAPPATEPGDIACVMYTSGSTGAPKGTLIDHRSLVNNLLWLQANWRLQAGDSVLQKTPFTFDVSIKELLWPLAFGARVVLARPRGHLDMAYLVRLIADRQITVTHFVPSLLQRFLDTPGAGDCRSLRLVMCGAEVLPPRLKDRFFFLLEAKLLHLYGPTEAAISVTGWECERQQEDRAVIPLGRAMSNVQLYLLDRSGRPVPPGVPGEIFIGGVAVARGYLKRPELTAQRFVPDRFQPRNEPAVLYRTGDLARFRPDGVLEFIGRIDQQVKIRGARVEPREVEVTLNRHPAVKRAAVRPQADRNGETRLIAYVLHEEQSSSSAFSLREHCASALPAFMVPAAFVTIDAMPLLANGKIDYSRLPGVWVGVGERS